MNKLKSTFLPQRRSSSKIHLGEKKRSQVFMEHLSSDVERREQEQDEIPKVQLEDLTDAENAAYQGWWKDLDTFNMGKLDNTTVFKFVSQCQLCDSVLEEILALFQNQKQGLECEQFFAMLRLIAHAQNGRTVNRDIVYLGAPLPYFQIDPITATVQYPVNTSNASAVTMDSPSSSAIIDPSIPINTSVQHSRSRSVPYATNAFLSLHPPHSPANDLYEFDTIGASIVKQRSHSLVSRSGSTSLDQDSLLKVMKGGGTGQSLLLTQEFKPVITEENDDEDSGTSDIDSDSEVEELQPEEEKRRHSHNPYLNIASNNNPFDTDDSPAFTPKQDLTPPAAMLEHINERLNSLHMPPPPAPPQSTKPKYPKYRRFI